MNTFAVLKAILFLLVIATASLMVSAQSSSLYVNPTIIQPEPVSRDGIPNRLSVALAETSLTAVRLPDPRQFAVHDLVTIIVRESIEADASASLETNKEITVDGILKQFPNLDPIQLLQFNLDRGDLDGNQPEVSLEYKNEFEGDGDYARSDTFTTRLTSRIIDIKPNGTLVLEARKFIRTDKESVNVVLTGTCRKDDVSANNTVLSTQIYDMRLIKEHTGELRKATKKGLITRAFELIFNF